jgi:hypothetical protein
MSSPVSQSLHHGCTNSSGSYILSTFVQNSSQGHFLFVRPSVSQSVSQGLAILPDQGHSFSLSELDTLPQEGRFEDERIILVRICLNSMDSYSRFAQTPLWTLYGTVA